MESMRPSCPRWNHLQTLLVLLCLYGTCLSNAVAAVGIGGDNANHGRQWEMRQLKQDDASSNTEKDKGTSDKDNKGTPAPMVTPLLIQSSAPLTATTFPTSAPQAFVSLVSFPPVAPPRSAGKNVFSPTSGLNATSRPVTSPSSVSVRQPTLPPSPAPSLLNQSGDAMTVTTILVPIAVEANATLVPIASNTNNGTSNGTSTSPVSNQDVRVASPSPDSLNMLLIWSIVAGGIAFSVTGSLLLFRGRHKFVQNKKRAKRQVVELNDTMGTNKAPSRSDEDKDNSSGEEMI